MPEASRPHHRRAFRSSAHQHRRWRPPSAPGYDAELDELRDLSQNGRQYVAQIEARERQRTGIASLKVRFNNVFGYYIEISKANLHLTPADYERKQTLVNAERFTTPELKEYERKILAAEEKILEIEKRIFTEMRQKAADHAQRIRPPRPLLPNSMLPPRSPRWRRRIATRVPGFHAGDTRAKCASTPAAIPVIEKLANEEAGPVHSRTICISTMRPTARHHHRPEHGRQKHLSAAGRADRDPCADGFVGAREAALLPLIDRIFTRIGASDNLARGPFHIHGGDDGDGGDSEYGDAA